MGKKVKKKPQQLPNLLFFALLKKPKTSRDHINRAYAIYYWRKCRGKKTRIKIIINFLLSPFTILKDIQKTSGISKNIAGAGSEKGRLQRFLEEFYLSFFYSIHPQDYYLQGFYKKDGLYRAKYYYNKGVLKQGVYKLLLNYGRYKNHHHKEVYSLGNKKEFFDFCIKKKMPTIPVELEFLSDGSVKSYAEGDKELPEKNLFLKPTFDKEGQGAETWFWNGQGYENVKGKFLDKDSLTEHIKKRAKSHERGTILVQPLILPHKELSSFRKNATPTIRILTYRNKKDKIRIGPGMFRFSLDKTSVVDNASAGGVMAPIDMETGILGAAMYSDPTIYNEPIENLKKGKAQVKGKTLPYWQETIDLVKKAHKHFPDRYIIGWDILVTDQGPILVEGNAQPGIDYIQRTHGCSIGELKIGKALAKHSQRAIELLYSGKLRKDIEDKIQVHIFDNSSFKKWKNLVFFREKIAIQVSIHGKVQRVGYRKWLKERAKAHHIKGWGQNKKDGSVEAVFIGKTLEVEDLYRECYHGPERARVDTIHVRKIIPKDTSGFKIKRE